MMDAARPVYSEDHSDTLDAALGADAVENIIREGGAVSAIYQRTGIRALVDSAVVTNERLPMLEVVFDRFVRALTTSMRNFTSDNIEISIERVFAARFSEFIQDVTAPSLLSVVHTPQWDNYALFVVDAPLTYAVVDALLGGRRYQGQQTKLSRSFTQIETRLISKMLGLAAEDLSKAFAPLTHIEFKNDRLETNPLFAAIVQPTNVCAIATINLKMEDHGGTFSIVLPYVTIEPIRELLLQRFVGEKFGHDGIWEDHLVKEIRQTSVQIEAVLGEKVMRLGEVMNFQVGQVLSFALGKNDPIDVRSGGVQLGQATIGRMGKSIAIKVASTEASKDKK